MVRFVASFTLALALAGGAQAADSDTRPLTKAKSPCKLDIRLSDTAYKKPVSKIVADLRTLAKQDPTHIFLRQESLLDFGDTLLNQGRIGGAMDVFGLMLEMYPGSALSFDGIARAYVLADQPEDAAQFYAMALAAEPNYDRADIARAFVKQRQKL